MAPADQHLSSRVEVVRRFSRFYTRKIGVLDEHLPGGPFSLTEGRVVYELAHHEGTTAAELARELDLDASYLSRILKQLESHGFVKRSRSEHDGRERVLELDERGQTAFASLNARSREQVTALIGALDEEQQAQLVASMGAIEQILDDRAQRHVPFILRMHEAGDIGWVIQRHGVLYGQEFGWDLTFEGLVAEIAAKFLREFKPARERCWIAEKDGQNVGSVFLVEESADVAKLRLLLVEPAARGLGVGQRLVHECIRFARARGYGQLTLWTNDVLIAARRIYQQAGFELVSEEPHHSFGHDLVGQYWTLRL